MSLRLPVCLCPHPTHEPVPLSHTNNHTQTFLQGWVAIPGPAGGSREVVSGGSGDSSASDVGDSGGSMKWCRRYRHVDGENGGNVK